MRREAHGVGPPLQRWADRVEELVGGSKLAKAVTLRAGRR
jgi:hypothetical protein